VNADIADIAESAGNTVIGREKEHYE